MKVILLHDVPKLGKKYATAEVSDGHALNFLIPKKLAEVATSSALKRIEKLTAGVALKQEISEALAKKLISQISGYTTKLKAKASETGHLFGALHEKEIAEAISQETKAQILPEMVELKEPIKSIGAHDVLIKIGNQKAKVKLLVEA